MLTRVVLRNYRSIAACDVRPTPFSILVGPNAAGKSNFLDALRFVADALRFSLEHAIRSRGGIREVRTRSAGHHAQVGSRLDFRLSEHQGFHACEIGAKRGGAYEVTRETCHVLRREGGSAVFFDVRRGRVVRSSFDPPPAASHRLFLNVASRLPELRRVRDTLAGMAFYNFNISALQSPGAAHPEGVLRRDGANLADVFAGLDAASRAEVVRYLTLIVPGISDVDTHVVDGRRLLRCWQDTPKSGRRWSLSARAMSDGTLRVLATLVAMRQPGERGRTAPCVVGLEKPESIVHPAASEVLLEAMRANSRRVQIFAASHGADLLDTFDLPRDAVLAVSMEDGHTRIGPLDDAGTSSIRDRRFTVGELLRLDQLRRHPACPLPGRATLFEELVA